MKLIMQSQAQVKKSVQIRFENNEALEIFGAGNANLKFLEENVPVSIKARGGEIILEGTEEQVGLAERCLYFLKDLVSKGQPVEKNDLIDTLRAFSKSTPEAAREVFQKDITISKKKSIHTRTHGQKRYVEAIEAHDIVFGIGPAGTGKTYLAMAVAMTKLLNGEVERIVLTRPAVEAGEKLGFLPGDLIEKVNPYLRPLYDALHDMVDLEKAQRFVASGQIEIAPLAFMRGRTLNDSYVILDEAQNTTREQMKMFLTRLGRNSCAVITGDITQIDLPRETRSGLRQALKLLHGVKGICIHYFTESDVVRHPLVAEIIKAYDQAERIP
jgi:phosphate starvation-inducible PhoH-like protein